MPGTRVSCLPRCCLGIETLEPAVAERESPGHFVDGVLVGADGYPLREPHLVDGEPLGKWARWPKTASTARR